MAHAIVGLESLRLLGPINRVGAQVEVDAAVLRQNFFFSGKPWFLLWRPSTDGMRPTHRIQNNLLSYS